MSIVLTRSIFCKESFLKLSVNYFWSFNDTCKYSVKTIGNVLFEWSCKVSGIATSNCGCTPLYIDKLSTAPCDTFGMICYEESIRNGTKNLDIQKDCYPACKSIMYFLEEKSRNLMESLSFNIDVYGKEYADFLENMLIPEPGMYDM